MRFLHLADLHFGKMLHGVSLLENGDQTDWVDKFIRLVEEQRPDAVAIAGDVYDRSMPSAEAVKLFSRMVTAISALGIPVLIAAGNHDSGERLACFRGILAYRSVHISGVLEPELAHITLNDEHGPVTFWLLPYVFPALAAQVLKDDSIRDYDTAVRRILAAQDIDYSARNVLIAHQNVTKGGVEGMRGGSESTVGGVGQVDYTAFDGFDYVALGHIHASYAVGRECVRYAGSPLCYHFDEINQPTKGPLMVRLGEKGSQTAMERLNISPLHPLAELRGTLEELRTVASHEERGKYIKIVLTDRPLTPEISVYFQDLFKARGSVLMEMKSEYRRFGGIENSPERKDMENKPVEQLFSDFYTERCGGEPETEDVDFMHYAAELLRNSDAGPEGKDVDPSLAGKLVDYLVKEAG